MIERKCIATREIKPINELFRVVRLTDNSVVVEKEIRLQGRGAYLSKNISAILIAQKKNLLAKALRCQVKDSIYLELIEQLKGGK